MKIIFVPASSRRCRISGSVSTAARRPFSGSLPAPRPSAPRRIFCSTGLLSSACWSVLQTMNVTPRIPRFHMWFTALPPAPPTPTTMMIEPSARGALISDIKSSVISLVFLFFAVIFFLAPTAPIGLRRQIGTPARRVAVRLFAAVRRADPYRRKRRAAGRRTAG